MTSRRDVIKAGAMAAMAGALPSSVAFADPMPEQHKPAARTFWPDRARMVISVSMQMEAGAQPSSGAESPMPKIDPKYPDLPASKWYDYGYKEGLPRLHRSFRAAQDQGHIPYGRRSGGPAPCARKRNRSAWARSI